MPQHRYACSACGRERVELVLRARELPPTCCGAAMTKVMPRRVVGRCTPDSNGVHAGSGFARVRVRDAEGELEKARPRVVEAAEGDEIELLGDPDAPGLVPKQRWVSTPLDPDDPTAIPEPEHAGVWAKDYAECSADQRDARWQDTAEALTTWHARQLEAQGETPKAARSVASEASQRTVERARGEASREDGVT